VIERKYLAHFIDANKSRVNEETGLPSGSTRYIRLGKYLESYAEEMNAQVEQFKNILGEPVVIVSGYEPSGSVDKFYAEENDPLYTMLENIVLGRLCGEDCRTTCIDAMITVGTKTNITWAYKEDCYIVVQSYGGDTSGIQIPFQIVKAGNRVDVTQKFKKADGSNYWMLD